VFHAISLFLPHLGLTLAIAGMLAVCGFGQNERLFCRDKNILPVDKSE
jgi:hypothetical protein